MIYHSIQAPTKKPLFGDQQGELTDITLGKSKSIPKKSQDNLIPQSHFLRKSDSKVGKDLEIEGPLIHISLYLLGPGRRSATGTTWFDSLDPPEGQGICVGMTLEVPR